MTRVLLLIAFFVTATLAADFCWKDSYGRGVGAPLSVCRPGLEKDGALCYDPCRAGYYGVGPVCWARCPDGQKDTGAQCEKHSYGRGVGRPLHTCRGNEEKSGALCYPRCNDDHYSVGPVCWQRCPGGYTDDGALCRRNAHIYGKGCCCTIFGCCGGRCPSDYHNDPCTCRKDVHIFAKHTYGRGAGSVLHCGDNEEEQAGLCYDKPRDGFKGVGPVVWENCRGETIDFGAFCTKKTFGRGAGVPMVCRPDQEHDAGLCYKRCDAGFKGIGPVCWAGCPKSWADCGAGCARDSHECADKIIDMVSDTGFMIANIAGMVVGTSAATKGAQTAAKVAKYAKKSLSIATKIAKYGNKIVKKAHERGEQMTEEQGLAQAEEIAGKAMGVIDGEMDEMDIAEKAMDLVAKVDPTGVVACAKAFMHRKCSQIKE